MKPIISKLYPLIIVKEWMECGEFQNTDKIIVIGSKFYARAVKILFRGSEKKILHADGLTKIYKNKSRTKWIIFDKSLVKDLPQSNYDILNIPNLRG